MIKEQQRRPVTKLLQFSKQEQGTKLVMTAGNGKKEERNGVIMEGGKRSREVFCLFFGFFLWKHDNISRKVPLEEKTDDKRVQFLEC